jgi:hypothetical protein
LNVHNPEYLLSESELNNAQQFWIQMWRAGGIESEERGAWTSLVNSHGSGRAAFIISEYKPATVIPIKNDESEHFLIVTSALSLTNDEKTASQYLLDQLLAG